MRNSRKVQGQFHRRPNIALRLAAILLILVCLSIWLMDGLFARYRTSDDGGDGARVMSFGQLTLTETGDFVGSTTNKTGILIPGVNLKKDVKVSFTGSEAATYLFVEVELPGQWQQESALTFSTCNKKISWGVADGWKYLPQTVKPTSYVYFYQVKSMSAGENVVPLAPNTPIENIPFIAGANGGVIQVGSDITRTEMAAMAHSINGGNPLAIILRAIVVQANGFESVEDAWASVAGSM